MKLSLLITGKTKFDYLNVGMNEYVSRLKHYLPMDIIVVPDLKNTKNMTPTEQNNKEGERIIKLIPPNTDIILFDERGKQYSSPEFSRFLESKINIRRDICMIVGGAYGFSEELYRLSRDLISLSKMTFSHQMARLIVLEQIYRAMTILRGEPYHHD
jgi:23S rRNA (pseudouridine1915-N3)-methyltransferase